MDLAGLTPNTSTLSGENMIQIGSAVSEISPVKVISLGRVYSSRRIYCAKMCTLNGLDFEKRLVSHIKQTFYRQKIPNA